MMFAFTDEERADLLELSAISTDGRGHEVLVGLTLDETALLMDYRRSIHKELDLSPENRTRYRPLMAKHLVACNRIFEAERYLSIYHSTQSWTLH
jgi:hypothetical protein